MKSDLTLIGVNIKRREIVVWVCYLRQKESTLATLMSKMSPTIKRLQQWTDSKAVKYFFFDKGLNSSSIMPTAKKQNNY